MFEIYQQERDPVKIDALVQAARTDLETLKKLSEWDEEAWNFGEKATPS